MSRIGKKVITVPKGVKVDVRPDAVEVQGPKGKLRQVIPAGIGFSLDGDALHAKPLTDDPQAPPTPLRLWMSDLRGDGGS